MKARIYLWTHKKNTPASDETTGLRVRESSIRTTSKLSKSSRRATTKKQLMWFTRRFTQARKHNWKRSAMCCIKSIFIRTSSWGQSQGNASMTWRWRMRLLKSRSRITLETHIWTLNMTSLGRVMAPHGMLMNQISRRTWKRFKEKPN